MRSVRSEERLVELEFRQVDESRLADLFEQHEAHDRTLPIMPVFLVAQQESDRLCRKARSVVAGEAEVRCIAKTVSSVLVHLRDLAASFIFGRPGCAERTHRRGTDSC